MSVVARLVSTVDGAVTALQSLTGRKLRVFLQHPASPAGQGWHVTD